MATEGKNPGNRGGLKRSMRVWGLILLVMAGGALFGQSIHDMEREADEYYRKREFNKAVAIWLNILNLEPGNERVLKMIELVYEEKQRKDLSIQRARLNYKIAKKTLDINNNISTLTDAQIQQNIIIIRKKADIAISSFIAAYRIDPADPDMIALRDSMRTLEQEVKAEEEKGRLSLASRKKVLELKANARIEMDRRNYDGALGMWNQVLVILPLDSDAQEGKRNCELAIQNRLHYEKITSIMARGIALFGAKDYKAAQAEFLQVIALDNNNREARRYLDLIEEKMEEARLFEATRQQAEDFYLSGINNLKENRFRMAEEDFQNVLALIPNYKDTPERLRSVKRQEEEYLRRRREDDLRKINKEFQDGIIALSEGRYREAVASFEIALALDPSNERAKEYIERAKDALRAEHEEVVDINSPYYDIINSLTVAGKKLYEQKRYEESRKKWDGILSLFPKNKIAQEYLLRCELMLNPGSYERFTTQILEEGRDLLGKKDYRGALKKFELLKSINAAYPGIDGLIAQAKRGAVRGTRPELTDADRAEIERRYRVGLDFYTRGGRENYERAMAEFRWVVTRDPDHIKAVISLNKIETTLRVNNRTETVQRRQLTAEQQQLVLKHYHLGISYYTNNDLRKAIDEWRKVLEIDPDNVKAKNNIRKCLVFLGRAQ